MRLDVPVRGRWARGLPIVLAASTLLVAGPAAEETATSIASVRGTLPDGAVPPAGADPLPRLAGAVLSSVPFLAQETRPRAGRSEVAACILPDLDGDSVPDDCDNCVGVFNPEQGASYKVSAPLVTGGDVVQYLVSSDGATVLYRADQELDGQFELYSVPVDGSAVPVKLSGPLVVGGNVTQFRLSPLDTSAAFIADKETNDVFELYSVPLDGSAPPTKLSGPLVTDGDVFALQIGPDGSRMLYAADQAVDNDVELYSVPLAGPPASAVKLNGPLPPGGDVFGFQSTFDGTRVVYTADQVANDVFELYAVPIAGPAASAVKLNGPLVAGGDVNFAFVSPDSTRVVYTADQDTNDVAELYSVPITGPAASGVKLNLPMVTGGDVRTSDDIDLPLISRDDTTVVYIADQDTNDRFELYSVPLAGPASSGVKLNRPLVAGGDVLSFNINADSTTVVYRADGETDDFVNLYAVPIDRSGPDILLHDVGTLGFNVSYFVGWGDPILNDRAVYPVLQAGHYRFYTVPIDGSTPPLELNDPLPPGGGLFSAAMAVGPFPRAGNDGPELVVYTGDQETPGVSEAYVVPIDRDLAPTKVSPPLVADGDVQLVAAPQTFVAYVADQDANDVFELYLRRIDVDADGTLDACDNCPGVANPGQGPVVFGQTVEALDETTFLWPDAVDADYVRGPLDGVARYAIDLSGSVSGTSLADGTVPEGGAAWYYLLKLGGDCVAASWQSEPGAEPARDEILP